MDDDSKSVGPTPLFRIKTQSIIIMWPLCQHDSSRVERPLESGESSTGHLSGSKRSCAPDQNEHSPFVWLQCT